MTDDDMALFGLEAKAEAPEPAPLPIHPEQVQRIRQAFEGAGITGQQERKSIVDTAVTRDVSSLRNLTALEGRRVLNQIKELGAAKPVTGGSLWDMREEDTWIDKL